MLQKRFYEVYCVYFLAFKHLKRATHLHLYIYSTVLYFTFLCLGSRKSSSLLFSGVCVSHGRETTLFTHTFSKSKLSFSLNAGSRGLKHFRSKIKHWDTMNIQSDKQSYWFYGPLHLLLMCVWLYASLYLRWNWDVRWINNKLCPKHKSEPDCCNYSVYR